MPNDNALMSALKSAKEKALEKAGYKKGEAFTHRAPDRLAVSEKHPDWGYRWCNSDSGNLERRESEGWLPVNKMTGLPGEAVSESDGMTGAKKHRELTLMAQPQELVKAHHQRVAELTERQTAGLKEKAESELKRSHPDAEVHGKIVIE